MTLFKVKASAIDGRIVRKEIEATSRDEVRSILEADGLFAVEIDAAKGSASTRSIFAPKRSVTAQEFYVFNRGLTALIRSGLPVLESLDALVSRGISPYFAGVVREVMADVRTGTAFSEALGKHAEVFPQLYVASVASGERTGDLVPAISAYMDYKQRVEEVKKRVVRAVTYPLALMSVSIAVVVFLVWYVVPTFSKIYLDAGTELPLPSYILITVSNAFKDYAWLVPIIAVFFYMVFKWYLRTGSGRRTLDRLKLGLPKFGDIYMGYAISKFARTLSMVLGSGVNLIQALGMSKGVLDNSILEEKLERVIERARTGSTVADGMRDTGFMPDVTLKMLTIGEQTASLPLMLSDVADFHDEDVAHKVELFTSLVEPALMVMMGLLIGTIVILLYVPIFQLVSSIQ